MVVPSFIRDVLEEAAMRTMMVLLLVLSVWACMGIVSLWALSVLGVPITYSWREWLAVVFLISAVRAASH